MAVTVRAAARQDPDLVQAEDGSAGPLCWTQRGADVDVKVAARPENRSIRGPNRSG
jgi:hypothetical protein